MIARIEPKRIVIATIGSLGDLHPCLALALELQRRGHHITVASTAFYRQQVEIHNLNFHSVRPDWDPTSPGIIRQCDDLRHGPEVLFRNLILPHLRDTYSDLLTVAAGADLMIAGELVYAAPLVAEKLRVRWASAILSPCSFFSSHDPSILVNVPWLMQFRKAGSHAYSAALNLCRLATRHWWNPVRDLRRELGLRTHCDPVFRDKFSPDLVLALFSRCLAQPQADWPPQTVQAGFVYHDQADTTQIPELAAFLASGDLPIVFTLGSTAVHNPGDFYQVSVLAARQLGRRAILLGAKCMPQNAGAISPEILALPYAPYSRVFPHAAAIVHQGGSGTTGQALRAGRPMLIVPYGWDQPDNGARVQRLGAGLCLSRSDYSAKSAAPVLSQLLTDATFAGCAADAAAFLRCEGGITQACDAVDAVLHRTS